MVCKYRYEDCSGGDCDGYDTTCPYYEKDTPEDDYYDPEELDYYAEKAREDSEQNQDCP